jgi:hypothetical protein
MGTHNRLLKIEGQDFPLAYLEIIAIDPDAPPPQRRRWFGLDDEALQSSLRQSPRLVHWVARSTALDRDSGRFASMGHDPGVTVGASRETPLGLLSWRIVLRDDGALHCAGALPTLIEWTGAHPTQTMAASGIVLQGLRLRGLPAAMEDCLPAGVRAERGPGAPMQAMLQTPRGSVELAS